MSVSVFNRCWSKVILETLVRQGVTHFCIAPGSRSTPLTLEAVRLQNANRALCHTHFDERGLGFFALGIAKSTKKPVAVIVTPWHCKIYQKTCCRYCHLRHGCRQFISGNH